MIENLFETNSLKNITYEEFQNSKLFYMDNFYKNPEEILYYLLKVKEPFYWKGNETPSYNGITFDDLRHNFYNQNFEQTSLKLAKICNQKLRSPGMIKTNIIKFYDKTFNDYKNCYWFPHTDLGYNAIVYLNTVTTETNFYEKIEDDNVYTPEHYEPWRPKYKYKILKTLEGKFNRLIMFDGSKFLHGMNITNDIFFDIFRINQVIFFS